MSNWLICGIRAFSFYLLLHSCTYAFDLYWPTPNTAFLEGKPAESYIQPSASGKTISGGFGCVRNGGHRFHEGVDLKATKFNRKGEALDPVYAAASGRIVYINTIGGNSAYGKYIVIEHSNWDVPLYTLYAHLSKIEPHVIIGKHIKGGTQIGVIGRSATKPVPKGMAHLHFEIGVRLSNHFEPWYKTQKFSSVNHHNHWNGMNLIGLDPLKLYHQVLHGKHKTIAQHIKEEATAFTLMIKTRELPFFIKHYSGLLVEPIPTSGIAGWQIDFTWYGLPKAWIPLRECNILSTVVIKSYDPKLIEQHPGRKLIINDQKGKPQMSKKLNNIMKLLFQKI